MNKENNKIVLSYIKELKAGYFSDTKVWKTNRTTLTETQLVSKLIDFEHFPLSKPDTIKSIRELAENWDKIMEEMSEETKEEKKSPAVREFMIAYKKLIKERFSEVDKIIWGGLRFTVDEDQNAMVVAPTGRGQEYRNVGRTVPEIMQQLAGMKTVDDCPVLKYIEDMIVDRIIEHTEHIESTDTTPASLVNGSYLPASGAKELFGYQFVSDGDDKIIGCRLTAKNKITVSDYIKCSMESFLAEQAMFIPQLSPVTNDPNQPTLCYLHLEKVEGSWATWEDWMKKGFENPEHAVPVFMAHLGSIMDAKNLGKNILWLHGRGNDGKSVAFNNIGEYFGKSFASVNGKSLTNQFAFSKLVNKRLVLFSDAKSSKALQSEAMHNASGTDFVDVEAKGKASYSAKMISKVVIMSNIAPEIEMDQFNQTSRLLYLRMRAKSEDEMIASNMGVRLSDGSFAFTGNDKFPELLKKEVDAFMSACFEKYRELCPNGGAVPCPNALRQRMEDICTDPASMSLESLINTVLVFNKDGKIRSEHLLKALDLRSDDFNVNIKSGFVVSSINSYLNNKGVNLKRISQNGVRNSYYHGVELRSDFETFNSIEIDKSKLSVSKIADAFEGYTIDNNSSVTLADED